MDSAQVKSCLGSMLKLSVMMVLAMVVVGASFVAGVMFERNRTPILSAMNLTSTPVTITTEEKVSGFNVFWEAWSLVQSEFYSDIPAEKERVYGAIRGMVSTYGDQNTAFIDPTRAQLLQQDATGSFEGIGASVQMDELGQIVIAEPFLGRPAANAGVLRGDIILEVDGQSLRDLSLYEAVLLIRGPAGSTVTLTVLREGESEPLKIDVVRAKIDIKIVESKMLENNIGYLKLTEFSNGASGKLDEAIQTLRQEGAQKLILDLRDNPGGFLSEAVAVSSLFIEDGVVVQEQRKGEDAPQMFEARGVHSATDLPLVVLINGGSASASEIVAGAIKDRGRGALVGEQSFGKGTVQLPHTLSDGSELRVTIAQWLTPNGDMIHKQGIVPDVVVERTQADFLDGLDPQLDRAVEYLQTNQ